MFWVDIINFLTLVFVHYIPQGMFLLFTWFQVIKLNSTYKIIDEHY